MADEEDAAVTAPRRRVPILIQATGLARKAQALLESAGREDLAAAVAGELERPAARSTGVVLCGEAGSGKSALVGALVDRPGLLPSSPAGGTRVHVLVRACAEGEEEGAYLQRADGERLRTATSQLGEWLGGALAAEQRIRSAEVALAHPLLEEGVTLIDTPGLGGIDAMSDAIVAAAIGAADGVVVVSDAGAPLSAFELDLAARAAAQAGDVMVALNRIDVHQGWRVIAEDDAALLARRPATAGIELHPVSVRMHERAAGLADPEAARSLATASGVPALRERVAAWAGTRGGALQAARLCRIAQQALHRAHGADEAAIAREHAGAHELQALLQQRRAERDELVRQLPALRRRVQNDARLVQKDVDGELTRRLSSARSDLLDLALKQGVDDLEREIQRRLVRVLNGTLRTLAERIDALVSALDRELEPYGASIAAPDAVAVVPALADVQLAPAPPGSATAADLLARAPLAAAAFAVAAPLYAAAVVGGLAFEAARLVRRARREKARGQLSDTLAQARSDLSVVVHHAVVERLAAVTDAFEDAVIRRQEDLDAELTALRTQIADEGPQRARQVAEARARLEELRGLEERLREIGEAAIAGSRSVG